MGKQLRPSALPYLLECGGYESTPGSGYPAQRGTLMDAAFRKRLQGKTAPEAEHLTPLDNQAVKWAVEMTKFVAGGYEIISDEEECRLEEIHEHLPNGGTADTIIPAKRTGIDLKSGRRYDYEAQMAAYALGCMLRWFETEWTMVVLYADQQEIVYYHFDSCQQCIDIIERAHDNYIKGRREVNAYCKWCRHFENCPAVQQAIDESLGINAIGLLQMERDPKLTSLFLKQMSVAKELEARVRNNIRSEDRSIPGYMVASDAVFETVEPRMLSQFAKDLGWDKILGLFDKANGKKVRALLRANKIKITPELEEELFRHSYKPGTVRPGTKRSPKEKKPN